MNEQTKEKIQSNFLQLLQKKHFMNITIRDLTTQAKINRGTFYLHYVDKYDLLAQMEDSLLDGLELHLQRIKPQDMLLVAQKGEIPTLSIEVFRYIQENAHLFEVFLGANNLSGFQKRLKQFFMNHFVQKMEQNREFFNHVTIPQDYFSSFAISAFLGLIEQWLENSLTETPEEMAKMYIQIIFFIKKR